MMVDGEDNVPAFRARPRTKFADHTATCINLVFGGAGAAPQILVEALLNASTSSPETRQPHDRVLVDLGLPGHAHIADHMGHGARVVVVTIG